MATIMEALIVIVRLIQQAADFTIKKFSIFDSKLTKLSQFLNGRLALFVQTFVWSSVACACVFICEFKNEDLRHILMVAFCPPIIMMPLLCITLAFEPKLTSTVAELFEDHGHIYTCLTSFVEMTIVWAITLLKNEISANGESWASYGLIIAAYYVLVTIVEILNLKDRGAINGCASIIILVLMKSFGFFSVPMTAAIVFGKTLVCSDCCHVCRAKKTTRKEAEENERNAILRRHLDGETITTHFGNQTSGPSGCVTKTKKEEYPDV